MQALFGAATELGENLSWTIPTTVPLHNGVTAVVELLYLTVETIVGKAGLDGLRRF